MPVRFTGRFRREIPLQIIDDDQIEQTIVVHVHPGCRYRPEGSVLAVGLVQTSFFSDIREGAVSVVVIQSVAINAGNEDVLKTIVIVVADCDTDVIACSGQPRFLGNVGKMPPPVVFKKTVRVFRRCLVERLDICSVCEEDVELAVIVVVKDRDSPGHRFRSMALRRLTTVKFEIDCLVGELNRRIRCVCRPLGARRSVSG